MSTVLAVPQAAASTEAAIAAFRADWLAIGLATGPAQRPAAEAALKKMYAAVGLEAPRKFVWTGSPFTQGLVRSIVLGPEFVEQIIKSTWKKVLDPTETKILPIIAETFRNSMRLFDTGAVKADLYDGIKAGVRETLTETCNQRIVAAARASLNETVWNAVWEGVWESIGEGLSRGIDAGMRQIVSCGSPRKEMLDSAIRSALESCIGACVKNAVWEEPMDAAWGNVRAAITVQMRVQAWESLWKALQAAIWQNVAMPIGEQVKGCGNDSAQRSGYGQHDAYWLAFYAYFRQAHGLVKETEPIAPLLDIAPLAGWFAPHAQICWISERPVRLKLDAQGRLHATDGPALAYPDGWGIHVNNGTVRSAPALQAI